MPSQTNPFAGLPQTPDAPSCSFAAVVPSDSTDLAYFTRYLYIGGAGDVTIRGIEDAGNVTFKAVPVGAVLPIGARRVLATGTTATNLIALY